MLLGCIMLVSCTIIRYPKKFIFFALMAMAIHRLPLSFKKSIYFFKLMGSGRNGSFDIHPDWQQWAILAAHKHPFTPALEEPDAIITKLYGRLINRWFRLFQCQTSTLFLEPIEGHGKWDNKDPFGPLPRQSEWEGPVMVLTRATIRLSKLKAFWQNVDGVATNMKGVPGFNGSVGIGELPFIKQATLSSWSSKAQMIAFAYKMREHQEVIKKTRDDNWYSEELFVRFKHLKTVGKINGKDPLQGMF